MSNLKETDYYSLECTEVKDTSGENGLGYRVTNKETGVKEFETFMLAEALTFITQTEGMVAEFFAEKEVSGILHS